MGFVRVRTRETERPSVIVDTEDPPILSDLGQHRVLFEGVRPRCLAAADPLGTARSELNSELRLLAGPVDPADRPRCHAPARINADELEKMDMGSIAEVDKTPRIRGRHPARLLSIEVELGRFVVSAERDLNRVLARHEPNRVGEDSQPRVVGGIGKHNAGHGQDDQNRSTRFQPHIAPPPLCTAYSP